MIPLPMRFEDQPLLWTVPEVYSAVECREFIEFIERTDRSSGLDLASDNPSYRDQDRVMHDDPAAAAALFDRLRPHLPAQLGPFRLLGLNERLRFYRYRAGQRFAPHMDHWYRPSPTRITLHTVLIYFNDDFDGGETRFCDPLEEVVVPRVGLAAIFQHKLRHEGCVVRRGTKYAMRTEVVFEAPEPIAYLDA